MSQAALAQTPVNADARLLASGCFQCHGTDGQSGGFEKLAGMSRSEMLGELQEMRVESARKDIMTPHARGYTSYQLSLIADYFASVGKSATAGAITTSPRPTSTTSRTEDSRNKKRKEKNDD